MAVDNKVFERVNLQFLREFLLYEGECEKEIGTYQERLSRAERLVIDKLRLYPKLCTRTELTDTLYHYVNVTQNVYMEVGIKCGAMLAAQLLIDDETGSAVNQILEKKMWNKAHNDFERENNKTCD